VFDTPTRVVPTSQELAEFLCSLVQLRHSRCAGRVEAEIRWIESLERLLFNSRIAENPSPSLQRDLFEDTSESPNLSEDCIHNHLQVINLAIDALTDKVPKETKQEERQVAALNLLSDLAQLEELHSPLAPALQFASQTLQNGTPIDLAIVAVRFILTYYEFSELPPDRSTEIDHFAQGLKNRDQIRDLYVHLVDFDQASPFEALARLDDGE